MSRNVIRIYTGDSHPSQSLSQIHRVKYVINPCGHLFVCRGDPPQSSRDGLDTDGIISEVPVNPSDQFRQNSTVPENPALEAAKAATLNPLMSL